MYSTITERSIADEIILMKIHRSITSLWCTMEENVLICLTFLHFRATNGMLVNHAKELAEKDGNAHIWVSNMV